MKGFKQFLLRGNVVDLAVGVIIGAAFNSVVNGFVANVLTPIISIIIGKPDFSKLAFTVNHSTVHVGDFLNSLISFVIVASVVYFFIVLPMNRLQNAFRAGKHMDPTTKQCPFCFSEISIKATRCPDCTSDLKEEKK